MVTYNSNRHRKLLVLHGYCLITPYLETFNKHNKVRYSKRTRFDFNYNNTVTRISDCKEAQLSLKILIAAYH